jgi:hypothetical protein
MANVSKIAGLVPVKHLLGLDWDGRGNVYSVATTEGNILSIGDPVKLSGSGDTNGIPGVVQATAGAACVGVIMAIGVNPQGPFINADNLSLIQAPATKVVVYYALVCDDPFVVFEVQEGGAGTALAAADIGENIDFLAAAPGTGVRISQFTINNAAHDTTSTRNCRLLGLQLDSRRAAGNTFGASAKWLVLINNHQYKAGVTGV